MSSRIIPIFNYFHDNGSNTGIHAIASSGMIAGNTFAADLGDAIRLEGGSSPVILRNNMAANAGFGINNLSPATTVDAHGNWWGDAGGPSGSGPGAGQPVSAGVDFSDWRTEPVAFYASAGLDSIYVPAGTQDTVFVFMRNWSPAAQTYDVTIEDEAGWIQRPSSLSLDLEEGAAGVAVVSLAVPAGVPEGASSMARLSAVPRNAPAAVEADTFLVLSYAPFLHRIVVTPDTVSLAIGQTQQFLASGFDQFDRTFAATISWSATGGMIDAAGYFTAGNQAGTFTVVAADAAAGISGVAVVHIALQVGVESEALVPTASALHQSYPNPFQHQVYIPYDLKTAAHVTLEVYDVLGRRVALLVDETQTAGRYDTLFDAGYLPAGMYIYGIRIGDYRAFKRMMLIH